MDLRRSPYRTLPPISMRTHEEQLSNPILLQGHIYSRHSGSDLEFKVSPILQLGRYTPKIARVRHPRTSLEDWGRVQNSVFVEGDAGFWKIDCSKKYRLDAEGREQATKRRSLSHLIP